MTALEADELGLGIAGDISQIQALPRSHPHSPTTHKNNNNIYIIYI